MKIPRSSKTLRELAANSTPLRATRKPLDLPATTGGNCARWLRAIRETHGITLRAIAEHSGGALTATCLRQIESRGSSPTLDTFVALCATLDVDPCRTLGQLYGAPELLEI
jgi:Helix-turn-helix domain